MNKYIALGFQLTNKNIELIKRIGENVLNSQIEIIDLASYKLKKENAVYLIFGEKTKRIVGELQNSFYLAEPNKLEPGQDEDERKKTFELLLKIKEYKIQEIEEKIDEKKLPNLSLLEIRELEEKLKSKGHKHWKGLRKNGEEIIIAIDDDFENASLTFSELYSIKMAMEVLNLKEINIVRKNSK